jgi:hypothetical protein
MTDQLPLLCTVRWQRPLQLLQHHALIRPARKDRLEDVGRQQREPEDPTHIALGNASASPISLTEAYTAASSIRCHCHARASPLMRVPSGCGLEVGTISLHGAFRYRTYDRRAMSEQPPEDPGKAPVLLMVAVCWLYSQSASLFWCTTARQHHSGRSRGYTPPLASASSLRGSVLVAVRRPCHNLQQPAANSQ